MAASTRLQTSGKVLLSSHAKLLYGSISLICKRDAHKINIQKPRPGSLQRRILAAVTQPIIRTVEVDPALTCTRRPDIPNGMDFTNEYEDFLIRRMRERIDEGSQGLMFLCYQGSCTAKIHRKILVNLQKQDFKLSRVNRKIFHHAVKGTKYETLEVALGFSTVIITHTSTLVAELIVALKKIPELHTLCGVVEDQLLSKTQLEQYALLPDKQTLLGQTNFLLGQPAQRISGLLTSQQEQLVRNLESYASPDAR